MVCRLLKILSIISTFWVVRVRWILIRTPQVHRFSSLIGSFGLDYLQSWGRSQSFWSLHLSLRRTIFQEWVASVLVHKHNWGLFLLDQRILSILTWCWLLLLLLRACRMDWDFWLFWECSFCNISRIPFGAVKPFGFGKSQSDRLNSTFVRLLWYSFEWDGSA